MLPNMSCSLISTSHIPHAPKDDVWLLLEPRECLSEPDQGARWVSWAKPELHDIILACSVEASEWCSSLAPSNQFLEMWGHAEKLKVGFIGNILIKTSSVHEVQAPLRLGSSCACGVQNHTSANLPKFFFRASPSFLPPLAPFLATDAMSHQLISSERHQLALLPGCRHKSWLAPLSVADMRTSSRLQKRYLAS